MENSPILAMICYIFILNIGPILTIVKPYFGILKHYTCNKLNHISDRFSLIG